MRRVVDFEDGTLLAVWWALNYLTLIFVNIHSLFITFRNILIFLNINFLDIRNAEYRIHLLIEENNLVILCDNYSVMIELQQILKHF